LLYFEKTHKPTALAGVVVGNSKAGSSKTKVLGSQSAGKYQ
jgi:hypothetical protein